MRKLHDCDDSMAEFLARARHLDAALGPILYQLPPRWRCDLDRLEGFLDLLPRDLTHVFEFREPSWLEFEVLALLDSRDIAFCAHDMPGLPTQWAATGPAAYVRFHGTTGKYIGRYDEEALESSGKWLRNESAGGRAAWAFFNNDIHADAIADAKALQALLRSWARRDP